MSFLCEIFVATLCIRHYDIESQTGRHKFERIPTDVAFFYVKKLPGSDETYEKTSVTMVILKFRDPIQTQS